MTILSSKETDAESIESYHALFWRHPVLACIFSAALLSLAGIPLTAGFIGKFYILAADLQAEFWLIAFVLVISSVISLYYYLRIITNMFSGREVIHSTAKGMHPIFYLISVMVLSGLALCIVWFGVFPAGLMNFVEYFRLE